MSDFDFIENMKEDNIEEIVRASENPRKSIIELQVQNEREVKRIERECWERARYCSCGADKVGECTCDSEKKRGYQQRTLDKINDEIGDQAMTICLLAQEYGVDFSKMDRKRGEMP